MRTRAVSLNTVTPGAAVSGRVCRPNWALGLDHKQLDSSLCLELWPELLCSVWHSVYLQLITTLSEWSPLWKWQCSLWRRRRVLGKHSALVSRLSSCPTHQLGLSDNFSQVAASLGNKIKLAPPRLDNCLRVGSKGKFSTYTIYANGHRGYHPVGFIHNFTVL